MSSKLIVMAIFMAVCGVGCASQEDLLNAELWSGDPYVNIPSSGGATQDLGKTPRAKMLEQRETDLQGKSKLSKDQVLNHLILGEDGKINF
ncbi:hypothetical protein ACJJIW_18835 [Microbulbifer sp. JMSA004]|uniref:hypothetical protein n=1 Tax=unclassified Microbulbifer TaxID=2619833 RepID=UPI0024AE788B|nr:hypothetical protein [Microbulbifer sp. VAAF005]WHI46913.1 hypothetical protein P0078_00645 [Microbulbifer sp. VAAF005]